MQKTQKQIDHLEKLRLGNIGRKCPESTKIAISKANSGRKAWNRGLKNPYSKETILKMSLAKKGIPKTAEERMKYSQGWTEERRIALSKKNSENKGEKNPNWRGGKTKEIRDLRHSPEYYQWKKSVMASNDACCVLCGSLHALEVDHIISIHEDITLALEPTNGRILCHECHRETKNYGGAKKN